MGWRPWYIFEIFQNGHIFLKFYFFKYKKQKTADVAAQDWAVARGLAFTHHLTSFFFLAFENVMYHILCGAPNHQLIYYN